MSCKISRRSFLKVSGCLMLGSAVSGLLCGAGDPADGGAAVPTVGGLRVNYIRAFAKDYGNNFRQMEIHLNIENTNSSAAYFNQENFVPMLGNSRYGGEFTFTGLSKWNGSRYVQDVQLKAGETQTISYSCKLQPEDLSAGLRTVDPAPWSLTLLYGGQRQTFTGYLLPDHYSTEYTAGPVESTVLPSVGGIVLSGFWSSDFPTQIPSYSLPIYLPCRTAMTQPPSCRSVALPKTGMFWTISPSGWTASRGIITGSMPVPILPVSLQRKKATLKPSSRRRSVLRKPGFR